MLKKHSSKNIFLASTSHACDDDMIYFRYAKKIASFGYNVTIIGNKANVVVDKNINSFVLTKQDNRYDRLIKNPIIIAKYCLKHIKPGDYFYFFTIDLIPLSFILSLRKIKIVQVFVENYYLKLKNKKWIRKGFRNLSSVICRQVQTTLGTICHLNIFVDKFTMDTYKNIKENKILLPNYPITDNDLCIKEKNFDFPLRAVYAGNISDERGLWVMLFLAEKMKEKLEIHLYGNIIEESDQKKIFENRNVFYHNRLPYNEMLKEEAKYDVGLAFYESSKAFSYIGENTTKIFEYMECGLPIIASYTKNLSRIIENETNSGICIFTTNLHGSCEKIRNLIGNKKLLIEYSKNGRNAFLVNRNWENAVEVSRFESTFH